MNEVNEMIADLKFRVTEIEEYVASNDLDVATRRLMDFVNDFGTDRKQRRQVINTRGLYSDIRVDLRISGKTRKNDILSRELRNQILEIVDDIAVDAEKKERLLEAAQTDTKIAPQKILNQVQPPTDEPLVRYRAQERSTQLENNESIEERKNSPLIACECISISKTYYVGSINFTLHPTNLTLKLGEITALVGENGSGKTTLLEMLAGVIMPTKGRIHYPMVPLKNKQDQYLIKQNIAYIPQELSHWSGSVIINLQYTASLHRLRGEKNEQEVEFIIRRLGLEKYKNAKWSELSSGFKMRFSLAKALIRHPKFLVLDEPLANLDINTQAIFLKDLRDLTNSLVEPMATIITSQHLHEVENIADNIVFLKGGQALYNGSMKLFGEDRTENSYELDCKISKRKLINLLGNFPFHRIEMEGNHFIIHTPRDITEDKLLIILFEHNVKVIFFRDISKSTRKLFSEHS